TAWNPNADGQVHSLAVSGSSVYAGGAFSHIGGQPRSKLAALDAARGEARGGNQDPNIDQSVLNPPPKTEVDAIAASGSTVYAGGPFTAIGGQQRSELAALDPTTGQATAWNANVTCAPYCETLDAMTVSGSTLYVGGNFQASFGGQPRNHAVGLDT